MNDDLEQEVVADDTVEVVEDTPAEGSAQVTDEEATESPATDEELTESPGTDEPAVEVVVVTRKRGGRRAASRPAGPPAPVFSAAEAPVSDGAAIEIQVPAAAVAAVFQAPEPAAVAPKRTRKSSGSKSKAAASTPADDEPASDEATAKQTDEADADQAGVTPEGESTPVEGAEAPEATADDEAGEGDSTNTRRRRRRGGRGRGRKNDQPATDGEGGATGDASGESASGQSGAVDAGSSAAGDAAEGEASGDGDSDSGEGGGSRRRRRRRRRGGGGGDTDAAELTSSDDEVTAVKGSTRLEAKRQRRREGRANRGMRAPILSEAEFLARRESVERALVLRERKGVMQIAVLEDEVLVEHYVSSASNSSLIGNVYLGRVQNVLPSMEAAFVDIGRGRNAVLYAGEVNWDAAGLEGQPKRIELALKSGDSVLVQVTKDPVGHKGARLTSQISLPGRFLVYVPQGGMTGISRKLPDRERSRLKRILKSVLPDDAGVIVRTAAEGASEEQLRQDVERLEAEWTKIQKSAESASAPALLRSEPDLAIKVVRDIFNEDFASMVISGTDAYAEVSEYVAAVSPDLAERVTKWTGKDDVFAAQRIDEQLMKALDRKVWLPSGGSLVIDRTEAMTVVDVNTGKFVGKGGNLEETVTRNNLEAAEEIVRQLRLRDIGGIIVVDFIDMVLESNRELVLRRLVECLSRDRTKHQVAEVTSLGLVQMTRKRIGQGLLETFSVQCEVCQGRGVKVQTEPVTPGNSSSTPKLRRPRVTGPIPGAPVKPKSESADASDSEHTHDEHEHDEHTHDEHEHDAPPAESAEAESAEAESSGTQATEASADADETEVDLTEAAPSTPVEAGTVD